MIKLGQCYYNRMGARHFNGWENKSIFYRQIEPNLIYPIESTITLIRSKIKVLFREYIYD